MKSYDLKSIIKKAKEQIGQIPKPDIDIEILPSDLRKELDQKEIPAKNIKTKKIIKEKSTKHKKNFPLNIIKTKPIDNKKDQAGPASLKIDINLSSDEMMCSINIHYSGVPVKLNEVIKFLNDNGITSGIDESAIFQCILSVNKTNNAASCVAANGVSPDKNTDGYFIIKKLFPIEHIKNIAGSEKKVLSGVRVEQNELLAERHIPKPGLDGTTVTGKKIKSFSGKDAPLFAHKNVRMKRGENVFLYYSSIKGILFFEDNKILKVQPYQDGSYTIDISDDNMKVTLSLIPPFGNGKVIESKNIIKELKEMNIEISDKKISNIRKTIYKSTIEGRIIKNYIIKEGIPPQDGKDSEIIFYFETNPEKKFKQMENGRIDFREFNNIAVVKAGDLVAEKKDATKGKKSGYDIYGNEIIAKDGEDTAFINTGDNITASEDNKNFYASNYGQVKYKLNKIWIAPVYKVQGDIDMSVGNLNFNGDIIIMGDINDDFEVVSDGNITVHNSIGAAQIFAGGDLIVKNGIIAKKKGTIDIKGNISAKFIENSKVNSEGDILITDSIMHSYVTTNGYIKFAKRGRGQIIGGTIIAKRGITTKNIGSPSEVETQIFVGRDIIIQNKIKNIENNIFKVKRELEEIDKVLNLLSRLSTERNNLSEDMKKVYKDGLYKKVVLKHELMKLMEEKSNIMFQPDIEGTGFIKVKEDIYPKVLIVFKNKELRIMRKKSNLCIFYNSESKRIQTEPFDYYKFKDE